MTEVHYFINDVLIAVQINAEVVGRIIVQGPVTRSRVWTGHYFFCYEQYQNLFVSMIVNAA